MHHPHAPQNSQRKKKLIIAIVVIIAIVLFGGIVTIAQLFSIKENKIGTIRVWYTELLAANAGIAEHTITEEMLFSQGKQSELILLPQGYGALEEAIGKESFEQLLKHPVEDRYGDFVVDWGTPEEGRYLTISGQKQASAIFDAICPHLQFTELPGDVCTYARQRVFRGETSPRPENAQQPYVAKIRFMHLKK
jgi:flagellar basal body-associated protein FliL